MFAPPPRKGQPPPSSRVMRNMAQTSLDSFQWHTSKSKTDNTVASLKGHGSPSPTQTRESDSQSKNADMAPKDDQEGGALKKVAHSTLKEMPKIRTADEGRACLEEVQLINPEDVLDLDMLAGTLVQISLFPGMSQVARDSVRAMAFLLAPALPVDSGGSAAEEAARVVGVAQEDLLSTMATVKAQLASAVEDTLKEIKLAARGLSNNSAKLTETTASYCDALPPPSQFPSGPVGQQCHSAGP